MAPETGALPARPTSGLRAPFNSPQTSLPDLDADVHSVVLDDFDAHSHKEVPPPPPPPPPPLTLSPKSGSEQLASSLQQRLQVLAATQRDGEVLDLSRSQDSEDEAHKLVELHDLYLELQEDYFAERKELEKRHMERFAQVFRRRAAVVRGDDDETEHIPGFWRRALCNNSVVAEAIAESDHEALEWLSDVRVCCEVGGDAGAATTDVGASASASLAAAGSSTADGEGARSPDGASPYGFRLEFHFEPDNPFFHNEVLHKTYHVPNLYGTSFPILESTTGCKIHWKSDERNLQLLAHRAAEEDIDGLAAGTFFDFFQADWMEITQTQSPQDLEEDVYEAFHELVAKDFRIGYELYQKVVPEAYRWYTGEAAFDEENLGSDGGEEAESSFLEGADRHARSPRSSRSSPSSVRSRARKQQQQCAQQ